MPHSRVPWQTSFCAGFIVPSCKGLDLPVIAKRVQGPVIGINAYGQSYFFDMFEKSTDEYPIKIAFRPAADGTQNNEVRLCVRQLAMGVEEEIIKASRRLAESLASVTDGRTKKPGLFVVMVGSASNRYRVAMWRFPSGESMQVADTEDGPTIQVLEDAYTRGGTQFKGAVFEDGAATTSFLTGLVIDKQAKSRVKEVSDYWVIDFLQANFAFSDKEGTKVLAKQLRHIISKEKDVELQQDLLDAAISLKNQVGQRLTLEDYAETYLPKAGRDAFLSGFQSITKKQVFMIDASALESELKIHSVMLKNGVRVTAPFGQFKDLVHIEPALGDAVQLSTVSEIMSETIKKVQ